MRTNIKLYKCIILYVYVCTVVVVSGQSPNTNGTTNKQHIKGKQMGYGVQSSKY